MTDRLIPLFAIGAFLTFTMSQVGMVAHWRKQEACERLAGWRSTPRGSHHGCGSRRDPLAKFVDGAWITVVTVPVIIGLLHVIRRYYDRLDESCRFDGP